MIRLNDILFHSFNYYVELSDDDLLKTVKKSGESENKLVIQIKIKDNFTDVTKLLDKIISIAMEHEQIKSIAHIIKANIIAQNNQVYLNDHSLILYSILESIEEESNIDSVTFIYKIQSIDVQSRFFNDFFSFIHGCIDFFQVNSSINIVLLMNKTTRDYALQEAFPQLHSRLESIDLKEVIQNV